jgi:LPXTG-motif cell wall-anchored protein
MRRLSYLLAVLLLTCGWVLAQAGSTTDQNSSTSNTQSTQQTDQNTNTANPPASTDQNTQATPSTSDQTNANTGNASDQTNAANTGATSGKKLPQTASPLPLLGLLGLGSLASGFAFRKRK